MLRPRIIPCLLIQNGGLTKTIKFRDGKYVGDPLNAVKIFNEKEVDELVVLDIDASRLRYPPNLSLIANLAAECRMPLCYGGGIKTIEEIDRLISLGVEKIAIGTAALTNPNLISAAVDRAGSQSIVGIMNVMTVGRLNIPKVVPVTLDNNLDEKPDAFAVKLEKLGVGELLLNSVDRDGTMQGYDLKLIADIKSKINIPMTALGGAGSLSDIRDLINRNPIIGAAAGSLFVFRGKHRAVLLNYPNWTERDALLVRSPM